MKNVQTLQHLLIMVMKLRNLIPQMNKRNKRQPLEENLLVVKLLLQLKKRIHKNRNNLQRGLRKLKQQDRQKQKLKQQDRQKQKLKQQDRQQQKLKLLDKQKQMLKLLDRKLKLKQQDR